MSGRKAPARTIFFGSGTFAIPILEALAAAPEVEIVGVLTAPDRPVGRHAIATPPPVAARARELGLRLLQPARIRDPEVAAAIAASRPELGVLADYGRIVPPAVLELPPHGILNVHPSLLPRHRGATPVQATILAGDGEAGVSIIRMDPGLDTGPIVAAERWGLRGDEAAPELEGRAAAEGAALLRQTLGPWLAGRIEPRAQDETAATLTRPLRREDGRLDPDRPAAELERQVRAYQPWPGSFVETPFGRLLAWRAAAAPSERGDESGWLVGGEGGLALTAADGRLRLIDVLLAGGRRMTSAELVRGRPGLVGLRVGSPAVR
jgi:methionyl-tRNA formyltransferase